MKLKLFFVYKGIRYYSLKKWCDSYNVRYSSSRYFLSQFVSNKNEINEFLFEHGEEILDVLIDKYSIKGDR